MKDLLQPFQRQQLEAAYRVVSDKRTANKLNSLLLLDDGFSYEEVAAILRLDDETIRRYEKPFKQIGLDEFLKSPFEGGTCKLSDIHGISLMSAQRLFLILLATLNRH